MKISKPSVTVRISWVLLFLAFLFAGYELNYPAMFISVLTGTLTLLPYTLQERYKFYIPQPFVNAIVFFVYATLFLGEVGDFYERFWWWDVVLHTGSALGFSLIAFVILALWVGPKKMGDNPFMMSAFAFCAAVAIGAVWEIFEFAMDQLFSLTMQKSGLVDTMWDLIVDALGALVASWAGYFYITHQTNFSITKLIDEAIRKNRRRQS